MFTEDHPEPSSTDTSDSGQPSRSLSALRADPELPLVEMAWSPGQMGELLNRHVLPAVWPGQEVTAITIDDMTYKPGKRCEILYSLQFADPTRGQSRWVVVTFANENKLGEIYRHHYGGENGPVAGPTPRPVGFLPAYGCLVEFFPMDWALPFLPRALEPGEVASLLPACPADVGRSEGGAAAERSGGLPKIEVLRYRRHSRCVLRYVVDVPGGGAPQEVIGKVYKPKALAVQAAQVQNVLHAQAMACGLIIPKPLGVVQEWGLLLMELVPGTVMKPLVKQARAPQELKEVIGLAAAALASLHRLRFESQKVQSLQTQLKKLHKRAASLHPVAPLLAQQADTLLRQITRSGARSTTVAPSFLHGDFSPGQLLMEKGQMAVIDFDSACLGDPAIDVGHFIAKLHRSAVLSRAGDEFRRLATYFLSEYQARLPENRVAERIHLFLSTSLVRLALRTFERWPYDYGQASPDSLPDLLLQEAAACLVGPTAR